MGNVYDWLGESSGSYNKSGAEQVLNGSISGFSGSYYATYDTVTHSEYILATAYYMGTRPLETAESTVKGVICGNPEIIYNIRNGNYREAGQDLVYGVGNATQIALAAAAIKKCGELLNKRKGKITNQSAIIEGGTEIRNRQGKPVNPTEKTLDMALDPETYANAVAEKYGINLRGSGEEITIKYNPNLRPGTYGRTTAANPNVIEIGPDALMSETELANTIAHELNHARDFLKGGQALELPAYDSGNALSDYINGGR